MALSLVGREIGRLLVLGFGVTGKGVVDFALRRGIAPLVSEERVLTPAERSWLAARGVRFEDGGHTPALLADADAVVLSPGVRPSLPLLEEAGNDGIPVLSEIDLAGSLIPSPIVAVTGTNGKSSVVTLIGALLEEAGRRAIVAGNIGIPAVSVVAESRSADVVVLEVSSYQLEQSVIFHPRVAVLLNLAPDHLARHGTMEAYAAAKGRVFLRQGPEDTAILPSSLAGLFPQGEGRRLFFDAARIPGRFESLAPHNRENLRAAIAAVSVLVPGFDAGEIPETAVEGAFSLPHRLEEVGTVNGVRVINDSKSTNPASAIAALRAVDGGIVLLLGGRSKGAGYEDLAREVKERPVRGTIVYGEAAGELSSIFSRFGIEIEVADDLEEGVSLGLRLAEPGDTLLLSPGCSSFDRFRDYVERGETFVRLVSGLSGFSRS